MIEKHPFRKETGVFLPEKSLLFYCFRIFRLLFALSNSNGHSHSRTDHGVVAHAQEAHHLHVSGDGGRTGKLSVGVHTAHGVGHAVRGRAGAHVVRVQGTASAATRSDREVLLASLEALLLVGASDGVLEARGVGGVTGDRDVDVLVPHDGNALADVVGAVAVDGGAGTIGVGDGLDDLELAGGEVIVGLDVGEAVDTADDLGSVLAQAVQDDAQGLFADLVGGTGNADSEMCIRDRQEGEDAAE